MLQTLQQQDQGAPRERLAGPPDIKDPLKYFRMSAAEGAGTQFRRASLRFHETGQRLETEHESGRQDQGAHLPSIAVGKLGACISLMNIGPDTCLRLKILRRHSIGNKERRAEQSSCLCRHTRTTINYVWNILASRLAALFGVPTASSSAAGNATERQQMAAGQSVARGEFASGDVTSGHPPSPCMV